MNEVILHVLIYALFFSWFYFERKQKRRDENDEWLYERRKHLKAISSRFESECREYLRSYFSASYLSATHYAQKIMDLEARYIDDLQAIYAENNRRLLVSALPRYLVDEYTSDIKNIAYAYLDILYSAPSHK